eukprot:4116597-Prymnesium_polylepis.1
MRGLLGSRRMPSTNVHVNEQENEPEEEEEEEAEMCVSSYRRVRPPLSKCLLLQARYRRKLNCSERPHD